MHRIVILFKFMFSGRKKYNFFWLFSCQQTTKKNYSLKLKHSKKKKIQLYILNLIRRYLNLATHSVFNHSNLLEL